MDTQTIFQAGNSLAVTIPIKIAKELGWKKGKKLSVRQNSTDKTITIGEEFKPETGLTPEFFAWKEDVLKKNAILLTRLSKFHGK